MTDASTTSEGVAATKHYAAAGFEPVLEMFEGMPYRDGCGAALCVVVDDQVVIDVWKGEAAPGILWDCDTLCCGFSVAKGWAAAAALLLVDRGQLDLERPVADIWPQFASNGKSSITATHILTHTAGIPWFDDYRSVVSLDKPESFLRMEEITNALENAAPIWEPGTRLGYHSWTYGWLVAQLVRRLGYDSMNSILKEDFLPAHLHEQSWIGAPSEAKSRIAKLLPDEAMNSDETAASMTPTEPAGRAFLMGDLRLGDAIEHTVNDLAFLRSETPASGAVTTARATATMYGILANGGYSGSRELVRESTIRRFATPTREEDDSIWGMRWRIGLGFISSVVGGYTFGPGKRSFGHNGLGGGTAFADPDGGIGFCYLTNDLVMGLETDSRGLKLIEALYDAMEPT